jgi:hypothetical protein
MMRESKIEKALVKRVKAAGGEIRKVQWVGRRGAPDRLVMMPGRSPVLVELKAPKGRLSKLQEREIATLRSWFVVHVVWSLDALNEVFS